MNYLPGFKTDVRPINHLRTHATELARDVVASAHEKREQTLALMKVLAMGNRDIEQGRVHDAEQVFDEIEALDQKVPA